MSSGQPYVRRDPEVAVARDVTMPSRASSATSLSTSVDLMQTSAPRSAGLRGDLRCRRDRRRPRSGSGLPATCFWAPRCRILHQLDPGDPGVDRRHRRRAGLEAPRVHGARVVHDVHREDVRVGEPPGLRRPRLLQPARGRRNPRPAEPRRYLSTPAAEDVDAELLHLDRERTDPTGTRRAAPARLARAPIATIRLHVDLRAVAWARRTYVDRDELRSPRRPPGGRCFTATSTAPACCTS